MEKFAFFLLGFTMISALISGCGRRDDVTGTEPVPTSHFEVVGQYAVEGRPYDVEVTADRAYIASGQLGLQILDITDPTQPQPANLKRPADHTIKFQSTAVAVAEMDTFDLVVINDGSEAFYTYPIPNRHSIRDTFQYFQPFTGSGVTINDFSMTRVSNDSVFMAFAYRSLGVRVGYLYRIDFFGTEQWLTSNQLESATRTQGYALGVDVANNYVYVAGDHAGLELIDITDIDNRVYQHHIDTPGESEDVVVEGNYAYLADGPMGLQVIDLTQNKIVGSINTSGSARSLVVKENIVYLADGGSGLRAIDVSDPTEPTIIASFEYQSSGFVSGVTIGENNLIYITDWYYGLIILRWAE
ncbi:MAG: hypothetical protein D6675_06175 [Gemmatimonadetes bacterium]|nr:MAG: hypothetical protein D6675_06175 [Gemmatimonadota bacterium]